MKYLKVMVIAIMVAFTFGSFDNVQAQVVVRARIGAPVHRRRAVVVVGTGPYYWQGRHYRHRQPYWRHHRRYYRYY